MSKKSELDMFWTLFKQHLKGVQKATLRWVTATEVDWDAKTMTANDIDGLPYYDVLLGLGTVAIKPIKNTDCLIAIVEGHEETAFLLYANEAELICYNGGSNGGLVIIDELKTQLAKMTARIDGIIKAINAGKVAPMDGGATLLASINTALGLITDKESFSGIEDKKITH